MAIFIWSKHKHYRGTVRGWFGRKEVPLVPLINLRAIAKDLRADHYWDCEAEELGFTDADDYWVWRWGFEITETLLHELTHIATRVGNYVPDHESWDGFLIEFLMEFYKTAWKSEGDGPGNPSNLKGEGGGEHGD
jgi:hypothetical protein